MSEHAALQVKPVRAEPPAEDGARILVDRLWPRGVSKAAACLDGWAKELAPSTELRRAFHGGLIGFAEFEARYRAELDASAAPREFWEQHRGGRVTLLYAAAHHAQNLAQVLQAYLEDLREE